MMDILSKKSVVLLIAITVFVLLIFFNSPLAITDELLPPSDDDSSYKDETTTNIGAWCDEVWEAAGFYSTGNDTNLGPNTWELQYGYTVEPEGQTIYDGGASLPSDAVVVEWKVTGHIHFASGL